MSARELSRVAVLGRVKAETLSLADAAVLMGVGYCQAKRLWRRFRRGGAKALRHRHVGRASNRRQPASLRARVLALIRQKYSGDVATRFGPTLVAEHLASEDGLTVDHETVRRWMRAAGLWSRQRKRSAYRQRRVRKAHFGELVQFDGSFHRWYEDRGPQRCLIAMVDDATSQSSGQFSGEETIWAAAAVLRSWIEQHGVPLALYTDGKNVYVRAATDAERAAGQVPVTQFGRMCAALQIHIIAASSPQAKGRVERNHGTHQDRLVKKLRRLGIRDDAAANAHVAATYWPAHNARFAQPAADGTDFHRPAPTAHALDQIFRLEVTRTIGHDWVVRYHNRLFQLLRQSGHAPARSTVRVCEWADGRVGIEYRGRPMTYTEIVAPPAAAPLVPPVVPLGRTASVRPAPADHLWRQRYITMRTPGGVTPTLKDLKGTFLSS
jgi:transposase